MMIKNQVVDAVQAALKTEMREIKKIQQALRQLADEVLNVDDYDYVIMMIMMIMMRIMMMTFRWRVSCMRMKEWPIS